MLNPTHSLTYPNRLYIIILTCETLTFQTLPLWLSPYSKISLLLVMADFR